MKNWDMGVDYESAYKRLSHMLKRLEKATGKSRYGYCYAQILLIQLRNGLRVSEAVRAWLEFYRTGSRELQVRVSKKRREDYRLVIIPNEIIRNEPCFEFLERRVGSITMSAKKWCKRRLGINTHSLRYALITYLLRQGVNPSIVAKLTKHSRLDYILHYTQEKEAERVLKSEELFG
jgi:site-specific recombinase XerD